MNRFYTSFLLFILFSLFACKRYTDPTPISDDRLNQFYCNDLSAVNYNWGFPGIPDNNTCIYPSDVFKGTYTFYDTLQNSLGETLGSDSIEITCTKIDSTHITLSGFCNATSYTAKAYRFLQFNLDSLVGTGQTFCAGKDTIQLQGFKNSILDSNFFFIQYTLYTDTGIVLHRGTAIKK